MRVRQNWIGLFISSNAAPCTIRFGLLNAHWVAENSHGIKYTAHECSYLTLCSNNFRLPACNMEYSKDS